jgi:hypothetical protein
MKLGRKGDGDGEDFNPGEKNIYKGFQLMVVRFLKLSSSFPLSIYPLFFQFQE